MISRSEINKSEYQSCQVAILDQVALIRVPSSLSGVEADVFKQEFQHICESNPTLIRAELDFSQTYFMDSCGIGALVNIRKTAQKHNLELILTNVSLQPMLSLTTAGLHTVFPIRQTKLEDDLRKTLRSPKDRIQQKKIPLPTTHPSVNSKAKRVVDIIGALVGLGITAILFIPIAIAIQLDDPGPIFFGQIRCSWMGGSFKMWKFRSMVTNAEELKAKLKPQNEADGDLLFKIGNDPRMTRVGRFLRKTSLDELPQFWSVLKGEMSLVGTRPPTPDEIDQYEIAYWQRLDVKPGMTGEWQVNGRSTVKNFEDVIELDLNYQKNWSLLYDLKLILKTIFIVFSKKAGGS
ncbi:MAG TPA: sugar transferase [Elainellaceae cyanobacterium]